MPGHPLRSQSFTHACGRLGLQQPRDALLVALCRYALPPRARQELRDAQGALSFAPTDDAYEPLPHTSLSAKNVLALKTLFNIAHCMGALLGTSWNVVLQTFEQLDRIIASSKLTASPQEVENAVALGGADGTANELSILNAALANLFTSVSVDLDDEAIGHFLTALSTQCFASLAFEATSKEKLAAPGSLAAMPPRLFALTRFIDTTMANLHRAPTLWPLVTQFLLPVANHKITRIRVFGIDALARVVLAAVEYGRDGGTPPAFLATNGAVATVAGARRDLAVGAAGGWGELGNWGGAWDRHLLGPLEELQRRCAHMETQERVLQCVHQLLRADGATLVEGWTLVLSILYRAATKPTLLPLLPLAIRSVQLIASDLLPCLPPPCLLAYVELAAAYAAQPAHLNAALTAVGLQWSIADYVVEYIEIEPSARDSHRSEEAFADTGELRRTARFSSASERLIERGDEGAELDEDRENGSALAPAPRYATLCVDEPVTAHELWCSIACQLRRLCGDERSEVRTCALHTLASILTSNGGRFSGATWDYALFYGLLPLMREVTTAASAASTTQQVAKPLGKEGGVPVLMLLHHSRDTASKQWDETWVLLLHSSTRLVRAFLPTLQARPRFHAAWEKMLDFCFESLISAPRSAEVARAAITALVQELLLAAVAQRPTPRPGVRPSAAVADASTSDAPPQTPARTAPMSATTATPLSYERLPPALWTSVWGLLERAIGQMAADAAAYTAHAETLCAILDAVRELYVQARDQFEEADVLRLLTLASRLAVPPGVPPGWDPYRAPVKPTALQMGALKLLEALPPFSSAVRAENLWPLLLLHLLKFVSVNTESTLVAVDAGVKPARNGVGFAEETYRLLLSMLTSGAAPSAQLEVLEDVLQVRVRRAVITEQPFPDARLGCTPATWA